MNQAIHVGTCRSEADGKQRAPPFTARSGGGADRFTMERVSDRNARVSGLTPFHEARTSRKRCNHFNLLYAPTRNVSVCKWRSCIVKCSQVQVRNGVRVRVRQVGVGGAGQKESKKKRRKKIKWD